MTFKSKAKKTRQYVITAPVICVGTFGYATFLGAKRIVKTTGTVVKAIAVDTFDNTAKYVEEVKAQ